MFEMWRHAEVQKYSGIAEDADGIEINMPAKTSDDSDRLIEFWLKAAQDGWGFRWGIGIITESARAAISWRHSSGAAEIEAFIKPENSDSIALALRLGMNATDVFSEGAQRYRMSL
jgi:RimJ/RimL family protein N-acetyltransferase